MNPIIKNPLSSVSLAGLLMFTATAAMAQGHGNLLANPGFDGGTCHEGWTARPADLVNIICSRDAGAVWLNYNNQGEDPNVSQTVQNLTVGETYRITASWRPGPTAHTYAPGQMTIFAIGVNGAFTPMTYAGDGAAYYTSVHDFVAQGTSATIAFAGEYGYDADVLLDAVSMVPVGTVQGDNSYLTNETVTVSNTAPPTTSGPTRIGIRWETPGCSDVDIDLYVRQGGTSGVTDNYLYYHNTSLPFGQYGEDIRSSGGASYEEVELTNVDDIRALDVRLNHYSGACASPISGEIRAQFAGQVYSTPFTLSGGPNRGDDLAGAGRNPSWAILNPVVLFNLN
ncbi:MAG: hypothetical protein H6898_04360 [Rhodobacter sp.]|nr:hypothetical protein [Paracoccaceae bacterium]MCC0075801.1 hypothetical protein [Rhodobacter sp.]